MTSPDTSKLPLVSVVVPSLNRGHFLRTTLDSILQQDYPHLECIVIDGGSTDQTLDILTSYGDDIEWVSELDRGHAHAINKGWTRASGDVLTWLNVDDFYVDSSSIWKAVQCFNKHREADVVYGDVKLIEEDGSVVDERHQPPDWDLRRAVEYCDYTIPQPTAFIKHDILRAVDYLDEDFGNCKDHDLWLRIGLIGTIQYCPNLIAVERQVPGLSQRPDVAEAKVRVTRNFLRRPDLPDQFTSERFQRRALSNSYSRAAEYAWTSDAGILCMIGYILKSTYADPSNAGNILYRWAELAILLVQKRLGAILS